MYVYMLCTRGEVGMPRGDVISRGNSYFPFDSDIALTKKARRMTWFHKRSET